MRIIKNRAELEVYLKNIDIPALKNQYNQYKLLLSTWEQEHLSEQDSLKQRIKGSFLWSVLKFFLPIYRAVWRFFWSILHLGIKKTFQSMENKIRNVSCFRIPQGKKLLASILPDEAEKMRQRRESCQWEECISVLVPLYHTPERYLRAMIESVQAQTYPNWQLCLADGSDAEHAYVEAICKEYQQKDSRICYERLKENTGIAGNTNACIAMAEGEYVAFFDHDDMLHPSALYECMKAIREHQAEFVYTDELTFKGDNLNHVVTKHYKPDFSPENLRGVNYICHLSVFRKALLEKTGLLEAAYNGSQDHDIILKLTSAAQCVWHIPKILYFWRVHPGSVSMGIGAKEYAIAAGQRAVRDQELRMGRKAEVVSTKICATHYRLTYEILGQPLVSIVIIGDRKEKVDHLLSSIYAATTYGNYEIIFGGAGAEVFEQINGAYVVFLHEDMDIVMEDWIQLLLMYVQREDVGLAAGRLVAPDGVVQEAGYVTGMDEKMIVTPIGEGEGYREPGYMGRMYYAHNVSACSLYGAMMKREAIRILEQPDVLEFSRARYKGLAVSNAVRGQGRTIVMNPYAVFIKEQGERIEESELKRADAYFIGEPDPYYNPNLSRDGKWRT